MPYIEVYDDQTLQKISSYEDADDLGHKNKLFCTKFDIENPNIVYSGGWDRNLNIWDIRAGQGLQGTIYGPMICGEGIDVNPKTHQILTGSQTPDEPLQLWDIRTLGLIRTFDWKGKDPHGGSSVYSCKLMKPEKSAVFAVGSNKNAAKVFSVDTGEMLLDLTDMDPIIASSSVVACDTSSQGRTVIVGSATGAIHVKNITITLAD